MWIKQFGKHLIILGLLLDVYVFTSNAIDRDNTLIGLIVPSITVVIGTIFIIIENNMPKLNEVIRYHWLIKG